MTSTTGHLHERDFHDFWLSTRQTLLRYLTRRLPPSDVDDVAQLVMLEVWKTWSSTPPDKRVHYMMRTAHDKVADHRRAPAFKRRQAVKPLEVAPDAASDEPGPDDITIGRETRHRLLTTIASLPPKHRALVVGRHLLDTPYEELAAAHGTTAGALRNMLDRLHGRLARELSDVRALSLAPLLATNTWLRKTHAHAPSCAAAGHAALVSILATTIVMVPPGAVTAERQHRISRQTSTDTSTTANVAHEPASPTRKAPTTLPGTSSAALDLRPPATTNRRDPTRLPRPLPPAPCIKTKAPSGDAQPSPGPRDTNPNLCPIPNDQPGEWLTIHAPTGGEYRLQNNYAALCPYIPQEPQTLLTCTQDEGTQYAVSPPPHPAED